MNSSSFIIFNASAGSGKTFTLVKEYLKILISNDSFYKFKDILAITFTNKAVGEMKQRIVDKLKLFASNKIFEINDDTFVAIQKELNLDSKSIHLKSKYILNYIINNYAAFDISTIDGFTHRIIRTFAHDLKLPQNFEVELDTDLLLSKAVDNLIARTGTNDELTRVLVDFALEKTDDDKSWNINYDLNTIARLLVNENHVSHLEKLQTKSLKDFKALKKNVLNKAALLEKHIIDKAKNVLKLIEEYSLEHNDFNGRNGYVPSYFKKLSLSDFNITYDKVWMNNIETLPLYPKSTNPEIASIIDEIQPQIACAFNKTKQKVFQLKLLKNIYKNITPLSLLNAINNELNLIKEEENLLLISEFNRIISDEIKNQPVPFIYERIGEKFKHYFIDEFQDTSIMQWENLTPLIDNILASENSTTMLVGDAKQAIYRWRGGKAEQFVNLFNKKNLPFSVHQKIENLPKNYRSTKQIVDFNNRFFKHISDFAFSNPNYAKIYKESAQEFFNENEGYVDINLIEYSKSDDKNEIYPRQILKTIEQIQQNGYKLGEICILVRKKKEGLAIAEVLNNRDINLVSSETLLLTRSNEVNFLVDLMTLAIQPNNNEVKAKILNHIAEQKNIEAKHEFFLKFIDLAPKELFQKVQDFNFHSFMHQPIYDAVEYAIRAFEINNTPNAYLQFFLDEVWNYSNKNKASLSGFLDYWETKKDSLSIISPEGQDAVKIMTIHAAKGLEFPVVIFPYAELSIYDERPPKTWFQLDENDFSGFDEVYLNLNKDLRQTSEQGTQIYDQHQSELELDNINLLYVALTRPIEQLYIIGKLDTEFKDKEKCNTYSRLLIDYLQSSGFWDDSKSHYTFGESKKQTKSKEDSKRTIVQDHFISTSADSHNINIITKSGYLWDTAQEKGIEKGNLIHSIMSKIKTSADIEFVLDDFELAGIIDKAQKKELNNSISNIVSHPNLRSYFNQKYLIFNEKDILSKHGKILRPDRIIINSKKEAVIIDYKTGLHNPKYLEQLQAYQDILNEMGYKTIKKILIYINDKIDIKEV